MTRYIAFLRAINVSGHGVIKMEKLRELFEEMKLKNVQTYIQTGNVIFDSTEKDLVKLTNKIEKHLHNSLNYEVKTMLRTFSDLEKIIKNNPFKEIKLDKEIHLYLSVLHGEPDIDSKKLLISLSDDIATFKIKDREVYTHYKRSNAKHPFSNSFVEKKLKVAATTRNWSVISKIHEIGVT